MHYPGRFAAADNAGRNRGVRVHEPPRERDKDGDPHHEESGIVSPEMYWYKFTNWH